MSFLFSFFRVKNRVRVRVSFRVSVGLGLGFGFGNLIGGAVGRRASAQLDLRSQDACISRVSSINFRCEDYLTGLTKNDTHQ